jgi:hypothetical protein
MDAVARFLLAKATSPPLVLLIALLCAASGGLILWRAGLLRFTGLVPSLRRLLGITALAVLPLSYALFSRSYADATMDQDAAYPVFVNCELRQVSSFPYRDCAVTWFGRFQWWARNRLALLPKPILLTDSPLTYQLYDIGLNAILDAYGATGAILFESTTVLPPGYVMDSSYSRTWHRWDSALPDTARKLVHGFKTNVPIQVVDGESYRANLARNWSQYPSAAGASGVLYVSDIVIDPEAGQARYYLDYSCAGRDCYGWWWVQVHRRGVRWLLRDTVRLR